MFYSLYHPSSLGGEATRDFEDSIRFQSGRYRDGFLIKNVLVKNLDTVDIKVCLCCNLSVLVFVLLGLSCILFDLFVLNV